MRLSSKSLQVKTFANIQKIHEIAKVSTLEFSILSNKGAFTKDVRLTPPGGGSEKPDKTGRWGGGRGGGN